VQSLSDAREFQVDAEHWHRYLETIAAHGEDLVARVTLSHERPRDGKDAVAWPLQSIRYDADADEIEIEVGHPAPRGALLRFFVSAPHSIHVQEWVRGKVIAVEDTSGIRTLIQVGHAQEDGAVRCRLGSLDGLEI
jgi:hypothetical protein